MYGPPFWHAAFLVINLYQIRHLLGERRRLRLTSEQEAMSREMLDGLSDEELVNTLTHAVHSGGDDVELLRTGAGREAAAPAHTAGRPRRPAAAACRPMTLPAL